MKTIIYSLIAFMFTAAIANLPVINKRLLHEIDSNHFRYANLNGSFTREESFHFRDPYISDWSVNRFVEETNPTSENRTVYRLYTINPVCFWRWSYYLFTSSDYPYKNWKEIEKRRVLYDPDNIWQDF